MKRLLCWLGFHNWQRFAITEITDEPALDRLSWWERDFCMRCDAQGEAWKRFRRGADRWVEAFVDYPLFYSPEPLTAKTIAKAVSAWRPK